MIAVATVAPTNGELGVDCHHYEGEVYRFVDAPQQQWGRVQVECADATVPCEDVIEVESRKMYWTRNDMDVVIWDAVDEVPYAELEMDGEMR